MEISDEIMTGYWYARSPAVMPVSDLAPESAASAAAERRIIYYRDPSGAPFWSAHVVNDSNAVAIMRITDLKA